ncbi:MAG TPA: DUF2892 domain-containing protein [Pseudobdellovibrionaceae bacterium]|nr:DUF2892 domain-containing protein [Pseudobdellovibrionaceae bacterium]
MKKNMGKIDCMLRLSGGAALVILAAQGVIGWWGYLAVIPISTAIMGFCPVYLPFGLNTCSAAEKAQDSGEKKA